MYGIVAFFTGQLAALSVMAAPTPTLTCDRGVQIFTQLPVVKSHISRGKGQILNGEMELGEVSVVDGNSTIILVKTEEAERGFLGFGQPKGFGLFEAPGLLRLDLRNTVDNYEIELENLQTGEKVMCVAKGDCC